MAETFTYDEAMNDESFTYDDAVFDREPRFDQAMLRGAINSPARFVQGIEAMRDYALPRQAQNMPHIGNALAGVTEPISDVAGPSPSGGLPAFGERIGEQAVPAIISAATAGATGGGMAALGDAALSLATPIVGRSVENLGGTPGQAAVAEVGFNMLAPSVASRVLRAVGYRGDLQPDLHRLTANRQARAMIPLDEAGGGRFHTQAADLIEDSQKGLASPLDSRTLDMVLSEDAPNFENLAIRKAQTDPKFQARIGGRKMHVEAIQDDRIRSALGSGSMQPVSSIRSAWKAQKVAEEAKNAALWKGLDLNGEPPASDAYLRKAIDDIKIEAGSINEDALPKRQIRQIEEMGGKVTWSELQNLRSRLGAIVDAGSSPGASDVARIRKRFAVRMRQAIDETIDGSTNLQDKYPDAIASHRRLKTVFDKSSRAYKALDSQDDPRRFVSELIDGRDAVQEALRVREMFAGDPAAIGDLKTTIARDTFQPEVGPTTPKAIKQRYLKRREAMGQLWRPDEIRAFDEITDAGIDTAVGKAGRRGMNYSTGSSTLDLSSTGFFNWVKKTAASQFYGGDMLSNRVMENYIMNPREAVPVLRAWRHGNAKDAGNMVFKQALKLIGRSAVNVAPGMSVEQKLENGG